MGDKTGIEWTDATWNPLRGCTAVSAGCDHCYAKTLHERFHGPGSFDTITLVPGLLDQPLRWRRPRRVFVNSMSDLFHRDVPDEYIAEVFAVMAAAPRHTFQLLTKRPGRMRSLLPTSRFQTLVRNRVFTINRFAGPASWPLPNVWLGVSAEDQHWADVRIPVLLDTLAAVRFVSAEPLLGPIDFFGTLVDGHRPRLNYWLTGRPGFDGPDRELTVGPRLDWVIAGGESGPGARPMHSDWVRQIRDACAHAEVPFLFKQWGSHDEHGRPMAKRRAGRLLDGVEHNGYPAAAA